MKHYVGLDVAMKETAICVVDDERRVVREAKAARAGVAATFMSATGLAFERVGIEAGPSVPVQGWSAGDPHRRPAHESSHERHAGQDRRTMPATSRSRVRGASRPWRGAPRCWCCRPARGPDRRPPCRPRTPELGVPWRIGYSPQIHQMKCYTKPLKSHTERVRRQLLSLRQDAFGRHSLCTPIEPPKPRKPGILGR